MAATRTVVLVRPADADEVLSEAATRLRAELVAQGFDVEEMVAEDGRDPPDQGASSGVTPVPVATIAVVDSGGGAATDLWVVDADTHEPVRRHVEVMGVARQRGPSVLAVRTVELLRASLLQGAPPAEPKKAPPKPAVPRPSTPRSPRRAASTPNQQKKTDPLLFRGELGAALLYGARGISPAYAPVLRLGAGSRIWAGRLSVVLPAFGAEAAASDGKATVREDLASLDVTVTWPSEGLFAIVGSAGGGGYHWHVAGVGNAPNVGHDGDRWGGLGVLGVGGLLRLDPRYGLLLDAQALFVAPPLVVRIGDVDAGRSGQPALCASIGFWVAL